MENSINQIDGNTLDQVVPFNIGPSWLQAVEDDHSSQILLPIDIRKHVDNFHFDFWKFVKIPHKNEAITRTEPHQHTMV